MGGYQSRRTQVDILHLDELRGRAQVLWWPDSDDSSTYGSSTQRGMLTWMVGMGCSHWPPFHIALQGWSATISHGLPPHSALLWKSVNWILNVSFSLNPWSNNLSCPQVNMDTCNYTEVWGKKEKHSINISGPFLTANMKNHNILLPKWKYLKPK